MPEKSSPDNEIVDNDTLRNENSQRHTDKHKDEVVSVAPLEDLPERTTAHQEDDDANLTNEEKLNKGISVLTNHFVYENQFYKMLLNNIDFISEGYRNEICRIFLLEHLYIFNLILENDTGKQISFS